MQLLILLIQQMKDKLRFEVNDTQGRFIFPETWFNTLIDEFEELVEAYDAEKICGKNYISELQRLTEQVPDFIDAYAHLAYVFLEQNAPYQALDMALKGLAVGNRLITEGFNGEILWIYPENQPYLRALYATILANIHLQHHQDAVILTDKILTYNPEDNQAARWLLGQELLRAGERDRAFRVLTRYSDEFSPYWYELGFLLFLNGEFVTAATAFRHGFATNIYIADILCGNLHPFPLPLWHSFLGGPDIAEDYYATYGLFWGQYPEALLFVNWLYNQSSVLNERARIIKCAKALLREDDYEACEKILKEQKRLQDNIDDRISEKIVRKYRTLQGDEIWPWMLPSSIDKELSPFDE